MLVAELEEELGLRARPKRESRVFGEELGEKVSMQRKLSVQKPWGGNVPGPAVLPLASEPLRGLEKQIVAPTPNTESF